MRGTLRPTRREVLYALLTAGCSSTPEPRAKPKFAVRPADDLLIMRVDAAYDAVRRSARFWPGFDKTDVKAMLIYDDHGEWFFGESRDLRGFYATGQTSHGAPITYAEPSLYLTGEVKPYARIRRVDGWLGRIGWRDFDADSRSKRSEPMMIIQALDTAMDNHHAIRCTEDWIGVYVHECFHVFQHDFDDVRRAQRIDKEEQDDRDILTTLASSGDYAKAVDAEFAGLLAAADDTATVAMTAKGTLKNWLAARDQRVSRFAKAFESAGGKGDLDRLDMYLTSSEGTAKYIEHKYVTTPEAFNDERLNTKDPKARQFQKTHVKVSITYRGAGNYFYSIGDLVCRLLDVADERWKEKAFSRKQLLLAAVREAVG